MLTHNANAEPAVVQCVSLRFEKDLRKRRELQNGRPTFRRSRRVITSVGKAAGPGANVTVSSLFLAAISTACLERKIAQKVRYICVGDTRLRSVPPKNETPNVRAPIYVHEVGGCSRSRSGWRAPPGYKVLRMRHFKFPCRYIRRCRHVHVHGGKNSQPAKGQETGGGMFHHASVYPHFHHPLVL